MKIRWIGQSGYILKSGKTVILIDPYLSDAVNRIAGRPRLVPPLLNPDRIHANAVVCTHSHADHLDADAIARMPADLHFLTTAGGKEKLDSLGKTNVTVLRIGDKISVGSFSITAVFARHTVEAFGILIKSPDGTLYFSGDTLFDQRLFSIADYRPDIAFLCINGKLGNMNVREAVETARKIGAKINVPNHYGMFASNTEDPKKFVSRVPGGFEMEYGREYGFEHGRLIS